MREHRAHVFVFKKAVFYLRNMVHKATSATQMFQSRMFDGEIAVKEMWSHGKKMSSEGTRDKYFIQKRVESMGTGCAILD